MSLHPLRIVFAGTPEFAAIALEALISSEHEIIAAYTQPDRPAGRGRKLTPSPVKVVAEENGIPVYQPSNFNDPADRKQLADLRPDLMVVAAYGLLLPSDVLLTPVHGCINIHASLLPRWRGAAPIHRALIAGDKESGITIMQMDEGLDTGDMLLKMRCPIEADDTSGSLHDKLADLGAEALIESLKQLQAGELKPEPQNGNMANYASKLTKAEGQINWHRPAEELERQVKGLNPWPVAYAELNDERIRVWNAHALSQRCDASPGTIIATEKSGVQVATGSGVLEITHAQLPGGKQLPVSALLNARQDLLRPGNRFAVGENS